MREFLHTLILQPLFNLLIGIYAVLPGHDFGIAIIIMTIVIRLLLWPLVRKQVHQQKAMQELKPEIAKIKKKTKGDKQKESQLLMELYKEREINPFASIGVLALQIPILATLFVMLRNLLGATDTAAIAKEFNRNAYQFVQDLPFIQTIIEDPMQFTTTLFGLIDLHESSLVLALTAGLAQYFYSKQLRPDTTDAKSLRDILNDAKDGKEVKMAEQNAAIMRSTGKFFPIVTFVIAFTLPSALALYWTVSNSLAALQTKHALHEEVETLDPDLKQPAKSKSAKTSKPKAKQTKSSKAKGSNKRAKNKKG